MSRLPISDYALLADCRSAALVSRSGSIDWLCFPRFDSPSVFGRILDDQAGHFSIHAVGDARIERHYADRALVLETAFTSHTGRAVLTDAMALGPGERGHDLGARSPNVLLRRIACTDGEVEIEVDFAPRPEYGVVQPLLTLVDGGVLALGGASVLTLSTTCAMEIVDVNARARLTLRAGDVIGFACEHRTSTEQRSRVWTQEEIALRMEDTATTWRSWSDMHQTYVGPWRELVHQSGRVLQALTYYPSGAIVAAPTTSLPESIGGARNWDYRFTWVRDASLTLHALWVAACPHESEKYFEFLANTAVGPIKAGMHLQIMFGIGGEHDLSERELPHLSGWRDSRPVRVGNGAWNQRQLDVYGELLGAVFRLRDQLASLTPATRAFLIEVVETAAARWHEKDQGIWEVRGEPRDYLHSKLMCWSALDRAIELCDLLQARDRIARWAMTRDDIRRAILEQGYSDRAGAFTQSFGSDDLDAASLLIPIVGFLPATDPRMVSTIDAIATRLVDDNGLVYRYRSEDGLAGDEGTFLLCTFWLAEAQALSGHVQRARETFERAASFMNDLGLLAEEVDPATREQIGNFPQAFSHIGLVNSAWAILQAEQLVRTPEAMTMMSVP